MSGAQEIRNGNNLLINSDVIFERDSENNHSQQNIEYQHLTLSKKNTEQMNSLRE